MIDMWRKKWQEREEEGGGEGQWVPQNLHLLVIKSHFELLLLLFLFSVCLSSTDVQPYHTLTV